MPTQTAAQTIPAEREVEEEEESRDGREIIVIGTRESLRNAQQIKRDASSVIDVITAEDLGRFSDSNIADALQRVAGVQIERNDDGRRGDRMAIRGLGSQFVTATINGRSAFSGGFEGVRELRNFSLNSLPSQILNQIVVRKTPTANIGEFGVAGQLDLQTLVPLEAGPIIQEGKTFFGTANVEFVREDLAERGGYRVNGMLGGTLANETLGWYVAVTHSDVQEARNGVEAEQISFLNLNVDNNGNGIIDSGETIPNVRLPTSTSYDNIRDNVQRFAGAAALQWQPNDRLNLLLDFVYSDYNRPSFRDRTTVNMAVGIGLRGGTDDTFSLFSPGSIGIGKDRFGRNRLLFLDIGAATYPSGLGFQPNGCPRGDDRLTIGCPRGLDVFLSPLQYDNFTQSGTGGLKVEWQANDRLNLNADIYYSGTQFRQDLQLARASNRLTDAFLNFDNRSLTWSFAGEDDTVFTETPYTYLVSPVHRVNQFEAAHYGAKLNLDYAVDHDHLKSLQFGIATAQTKYSQQQFLTSLGDYNLPDQGFDAILSGFLSGGIAEQDFPGLIDTPLLKYDFAAIKQAFASAAALSSQPGGANSMPFFTFDDALLKPVGDETYRLRDRSIALYAQVILDGEIARAPYSANLGLRMLHHFYHGYGPTLINDKPGEVQSSGGWQFLPSANFRIELSDNVQLRLGVGRTISQPEVEDLIRPIFVRPITCIPGVDSDCPPSFRTGRAGNSSLKSLSAWTFDATLEWYNRYDGSIVFSGFNKVIKDFIVIETTERILPLPEGGEGVVRVDAPINFTDGHAYGFEVSVNQPFTFLDAPFNGFGVQASYTHVLSRFDKNVGDAGLGWPGTSRDSINAVAYYEKSGFGLRVAYSYRSDFLAGLNPATLTAQVDEARFTKGWSQVNLNGSFHVMKNVIIHADISNVFGGGRYDYVGDRANFRARYERSRSFTIGISTKF